jgi:serine/threonine protein kinase
MSVAHVISRHIFSGQGKFGEVFLARAKGLHEGEDKEKETVVMVKSLQNTREDSALQEFKRELDMFHKLQHQNVAQLLGLCREADPHYMILEYTDWVCGLQVEHCLERLILFLRKQKNEINKNPMSNTSSILLLTDLNKTNTRSAISDKADE